MSTQHIEISQVSDWLALLRQLLCELNRSDIRSVDALLSKLTGDANAALMLLRLLYWTPKSKRDGWIYKSWQDWDAETNLSRGQIKRVHSNQILEGVGVVRELRKANGVPTTHYRIDLGALLNHISSFLGISLERLTDLFGLVIPAQSYGQEQPNPIVQSEPTERDESAQPITDITQQSLQSDITDNQNIIKATDNTTAANTVIESEIFVDDGDPNNSELAETNLLLLDLVDPGLDLLKAHSLADQFERKQIQRAMQRARDANALNPPGFVLAALNQDWDLQHVHLQYRPDLLSDGKRYAQGKYADFIDS